MWWTINRMKMSLQLFRNGAGKCPHTLIPSKAVELTETLKGGMPWCPIPPSACRKGVKCLCCLVWVSAGRGHVSLLFRDAWHRAQGSHTHATALLGATATEIQYKQDGTTHCAAAGLVKWLVLQKCPIFSVSQAVLPPGWPGLGSLSCPSILFQSGLHCKIMFPLLAESPKAFQLSWWVHSATWGHIRSSFFPSTAPLEQLSHPPSTCHSWIFPFLAYTFCRLWTCLWLPMVALFWPNPQVPGGKPSSPFFFQPSYLAKNCYWQMCLFAFSLLFFPASSPKWPWDLLGSFQTILIKWKWLQMLHI